jgi:hypothetical protein
MTKSYEYVDGTGNKLFVVFWTYSANYSDIDIVSADDPVQAFERKFPFYVNTKDPDFHKYVIEIKDVKDLTEIKNG